MNSPIFPFPFKPYRIQEKFMKELYFTLENGDLGIFESPTGTGKSLSICCGALHWLKESNEKVVNTLEKDVNQLKSEVSVQSTNDDWLSEEYEKIKKNHKLANLMLLLENLKRKKDYFRDMRVRVAKQKMVISKNKILTMVSQICKPLLNEDKENEEILEDHDLILEEGENEQSNNSESEEEQEKDDCMKIFISSRTHSQLSQFVGEIKRTVFNEDTRVVTLASRQHYCIHSDVAKLKNVNLINERCLDMQKSNKKSTAKDDKGKVVKKSKLNSCTACPYYNQSNINQLKERLLVDIMDMEDLVKNGKELKACPYYASRMAMDEAQVILISHAGIVSAGARSGVSLKLENNVLILDEAHGLTAALESAHSAPVTIKQLMSVKTFLQFYIMKYQARLSSRNLLTLNQLSFVVGKLLCMVNNAEQDTKKNEEIIIMSVEDFVIKAEVDHMNLRPLVEFSRTTRLPPKLHGFSMRYSQETLEDELKKNVEVKKISPLEAFLKNMSTKKSHLDVIEEATVNKPIEKEQQSDQTSAGSSLYAILDFLEMLCERSEHGRVLVHRGRGLKYLLLNPAEQFTEVVRQCRSVVVAGGTMEPISEFQALLTGNKEEYSNKVTILRCDHVVPPDNVLGICLSKGPSNMNLNFSYENRQSKQMLDEVGRILRNICNIVPGGVICFLPSYSYENTVYEHLNSTKVLDVISKKKLIFREPKSAADVEQVLQKYAAAVKSKDKGNTGALLLSVVGGKLSEGLNFSDDLGRCVLVVGMPYPNVKSPELQEKMNYINRTDGAGAGSVYYENLCMKAVNQCIGRAVRHANDYACVILVDERYSRPATMSALPSFVQKSLLPNSTFGPTIGNIAKFFSRHKNIK